VLPLRVPNVSNYPSLKEILGEVRAASLELDDPGPDFSDPSFWGQAMPLRGSSKEWWDKSYRTDYERQASLILRQAGFPLGTDSRMKDADSNWVTSLDQAFQDPGYDQDLSAADEDSAEGLVHRFAVEAKLTKREVELATWIADNGTGYGWTALAAEALDMSQDNVRTVFKRLRSKAPDMFAEPEARERKGLISSREGNGHDGLALDPRARRRGQETASQPEDRDWQYESSLTPDGYPFDDQV
jgi:hypothetical protein